MNKIKFTHIWNCFLTDNLKKQIKYNKQVLVSEYKAQMKMEWGENKYLSQNVKIHNYL